MPKYSLGFFVFKMPGKIEAPDFGSKEAGKPVLTDQQLKILRLAALGLTNQEIADELGRSPNTIKNHFSLVEHGKEGIYRRLGVYSRREAVIKAIKELGVLDPLELVSEEESARCESLTERQLEVLCWLADPDLPSLRETPVEIGAKLQIRFRTVKRHLSDIYNCLGIPSKRSTARGARAAVVYLAYKRRKEATSPYHERLHELNEAAY